MDGDNVFTRPSPTQLNSMSSSSWPPALKAWVQDCLAKATTANKPAVNAELKQILFDAHKNGTVNTTDWTKVELNSLKQQTSRTSISPLPTAVSPAYHQSYHTNAPATNGTHHGLAHAHAHVTPSKKEKKQSKKRKAEAKPDTMLNGFPSAYKFESEEEKAAKLRRLERFQRDASTASNGSSGPHATGTAFWFPESGGGDLGSRISGLQVGKKFGGSGALGYESPVAEVDPVSGYEVERVAYPQNVMDWDHHTIRGTSTRLEKSYLRLTSEPNPADVRPLPVLKQTLALLKQKWKENHNYAYALDQFKSMRQDLTVQRIKNEFTVEVYEIHGRIALEAKDLGEYNQCQSMLRQLYELGLPGHPEEFLSYRIMYLLHTKNRSDLGALLGRVTEKEKSDPGVAHALAVAAALATSNYVRFFRLFLQAPNMSGYIMDHFVERERAQALAVMSKAYLTLPLPYLTQTLAFENDEETDDFLVAHNAAMYTNAGKPERDPRNPWKPVPPTPLSQRVWDCKKAHWACAKGVEKYRVVDLKGQVD